MKIHSKEQWTMGHPLPESMTDAELEECLSSMSDIYTYALCRDTVSRSHSFTPAQQFGYRFTMNCLGMLSDYIERLYRDKASVKQEGSL